MLAGALDDVDDVFQEDIGNVNLVNSLGGRDEVLGCTDGFSADEVKFRFGNCAAVFLRDAEFEVPAEDFFFFVRCRVVQPMAEHEAVELGFGELEGSGLLDGVLSRDDEKRGGQGKGFRSESDFALLHRFEKRALDLGSSAVDFVGEEEVGKDGAFMSPEGAGLLVEDLRADDVGRKKVDGELNAPEIEMEGFRHRVDQEGLGEAGHPFEEKVAGSEEGDEGSFDNDILSDDNFAGAVSDSLKPFGSRRRKGVLNGVWGTHKCDRGVLEIR